MTPSMWDDQNNISIPNKNLGLYSCRLLDTEAVSKTTAAPTLGNYTE